MSKLRDEFEREMPVSKREQPMFLSIAYVSWLERRIEKLEAAQARDEVKTLKAKVKLGNREQRPTKHAPDARKSGAVDDG